MCKYFYKQFYNTLESQWGSVQNMLAWPNFRLTAESFFVDESKIAKDRASQLKVVRSNIWLLNLILTWNIGSFDGYKRSLNTKGLFTKGRLTCKHSLCIVFRDRDRKLVNLLYKER